MNQLPFEGDTFIGQELWKDIIGYEGLYQISNYGNVKSLSVKKLRGRFYHTQPEKILKQKLTTKGYLSIQLCKNGKCNEILIHRLVGIHFIPNPENKPEINHRKGNKQDNRWFTLEWATRQENVDHANETGLVNVKGELCHTAKLKNEDVLFIRNSPLSHKEIAKLFNVYFSTIQKIRQRRTWIHI